MADHYGHTPRGPARLLAAARWSVQGLKAAWLHESSFRLEVCLAAVFLPAALWLGRTGLERAILLATVLLVLVVELLNSAIEAAVDRFGPEHHSLAGRAKDMGSAAVSVCLLIAVAVWGLVIFNR